jgi:hypothetical protein
MMISRRLMFLLFLPLLTAACRSVDSSLLPTRAEPAAPPAIPTATLPATNTAPATFTTPAAASTETSAAGAEAGNGPECRETADCVLAVRIDTCCACPEVMSRAAAEGSDTILLYEEGLSYGELLPEPCASVDCEACGPPPVPVCTAAGLCRAQRSVEAILQECPGCYDQAAIAAYENGDVPAAIGYCLQADPPSCLVALFDAAHAAGDVEGGLEICLSTAHPDPAGCLTTLAPAVAASDTEQAVGLCQRIQAADVRQFGCMLDVASAVFARDPARGREICQLLQGERVGQCLEELG